VQRAERRVFSRLILLISRINGVGEMMRFLSLIYMVVLAPWSEFKLQSSARTRDHSLLCHSNPDYVSCSSICYPSHQVPSRSIQTTDEDLQRDTHGRLCLLHLRPSPVHRRDFGTTRAQQHRNSRKVRMARSHTGGFGYPHSQFPAVSAGAKASRVDLSLPTWKG